MTTHSDVFADALDGGNTALLDDTEMLLVIVDRLHGLPGTAALAEAGARPEFRDELRGRLLAEAQARQASEDGDGTARVVSINSRWNQSWARRNRARIVSGIAAGIVGLTAVSIAASNSLPGNPLYQLKRDGESVQYALAGSDEARGKLELGFARTRLHEIDRLTQHDAAYGVAPTDTPQAAGGSTVLAASVSTRVVRLFADMDSEAAKGSTLLARSFASDPRPGPLLAVQQFARDQEAALTSLRGRLAEPALSKATHSLAWAAAVVKTTTAALATCSTTTCPAVSVTQFGGSLSPSAAPSAAPSSGPSGLPSASATPSQLVPSLPVLPSLSPSVGPSAPVTSAGPPVTTTQPVIGQPTAPQPSTTPPTDPPTSAPPTSDVPTQTPTDSPTDAPTTPPAVPPTTPAPPPPSAPPTSDAPPASTAPPTTDPPTTDPPQPTTEPPTTPDPTTAAPSTSAVPPTTDPTTAPPTTTAPVHSGRPPIICLPPNKLVGTICIPDPLPPGVGGALH